MYRWRTLRTAILNANCTTQWIIEILNAHCAVVVNTIACLVECRFQTLHPNSLIRILDVFHFEALKSFVKLRVNVCLFRHRLFKMKMWFVYVALLLQTLQNHTPPCGIHLMLWVEVLIMWFVDFNKIASKTIALGTHSLFNFKQVNLLYWRFSSDRPRLRQDYPLNLSI